VRARFPVRGLLTVACLALVWSVMSTPLAAQILYGSLVGVVKDSQGAVLPGAMITIVNRDTNLTRETTADAEGNYSIGNVLAGPYDVKVSLQGFRENVRSGVPVSIGQVVRVDVTLELGTLTETITVESSTNLLQTDLADVHTELKSDELTMLPLNRFRNYQALMNLVPGTTPMAFGNAETDTPARSLATNVNGQANTNNSTRTDGATNMNIWLPNHNMYISPAETVDTVNISTSSFDAEQGLAGGAAVTVVTKSGTNQFKGSAFEFYNGDKLNSKPAFFGVGPKPPKLPLQANTFGGTVGGPVARNRLFFFGSYEGYKREHSLFTFFSVPDARMRSGDLSQAFNTNGSLQLIYNPFTGALDGAGRQQFANNQIPANMIDPIALKILQLYPLPNVEGIGAGGLTNNYRREETRTVDRKNFDVKLNFNRNTDHQIWGKFAVMDAVVDDLTNYLGPPTDAEGDGGFTRVYQATGGQTWTLSPTMLMDMTFGFGRQKQEVLGPDFQSGNFGLDTLGIRGTNDQGIGDPRYAGYPNFEICTGCAGATQAGFSPVGNRDGWNPIYRDERTYSLTANLTKVKGRHDFRTGYTLNFLYLDHWQPETGNPRGRFTFNANTTGLRGGQTTNFYNQYASFLLGLIGVANKSLQNELMTAREWQHALYFRDRWTPSDKLTLDLGLRWELYPIMHRANGRGIDRVDVTNLDVLVAGLGGNDQNNGMKAGLNNFAPRLGGIYRLNEKTVVRSGYGITYNAQPWARALRGDNDYPVTVASTYQHPEQFAWYAPLAQGIPLLVGPDASSGRVRLDNAAIVYTPEIGNVDRGMVQTWNAAFERRLPYDISVDVAYVGAKGTGGWAGLDINAPPTLGVGDAGRPYASQGRIQPLWSWGQRLRTRYNSLQMAFNKPFTRGFLFKGAYTLAKAMNDNDADGRATFAWNTPGEEWRNWGPAGFDRRHNFQLAFAYQLPWQSTGSYDNFLKAIVQDWQINGMFAAFSGTPFHVTASGTSLNTPQNTQTADLVGTFTVLGNAAPDGNWFDTSAFAQPTTVRFGNVTRNQFYGPGGKNFDFSLFRSFAMGGTRRLEARIQANNLFDWVVLANPQNNITSGTFGQVTGIAGDAALTNASYRERSVSLGLRFSF
jgi:hypothetical protein